MNVFLFLVFHLLFNEIPKFFSRYEALLMIDFNKIFTFEEIIFLVERCIVEKKTYLCRVRPEKWLDYKKAFFALS